MILGAVFIVLTIGIIKGYANSDGKTVEEKNNKFQLIILN